MGFIGEMMEKHREAVAYVFFGGFTTLFTWATYSFFTYIGWELNVCNILSWFCGVNFAFVVNKWYVFNSKSLKKSKVAKEYASFMGSRIATGVIAWVLFPILLYLGLDFRFMSIDGFLAKIITSIIEIALNWVLSKYFVFRAAQQE